MDRTPEYKKLCQEDLKLQALHKPETGDFWVCDCKSCTNPNVMEGADVDYVNKRDMTNVYHLHKDMVDLSGVGGFGAFWDSRKEMDPFGDTPCRDGDGKGRVRLSYVWLPRQDQLQDLCLPFFDDLETMHEEFREFCFLEGYKWDTMEKHWLMFYQGLRYENELESKAS